MKKTIILAIVLIFFASFVQAYTNSYTITVGDEVTYAWDANSEDDLAGYKLYWSITDGSWPNDPKDIPLSSLEDVDNPTYTVTQSNALTFYVALTAYDEDGNESDFSDSLQIISEEAVEEDTTPPDAPTGFRKVVDQVVSWLKKHFTHGPKVRS